MNYHIYRENGVIGICAVVEITKIVKLDLGGLK